MMKANGIETSKELKNGRAYLETEINFIGDPTQPLVVTKQQALLLTGRAHLPDVLTVEGVRYARIEWNVDAEYAIYEMLMRQNHSL